MSRSSLLSLVVLFVGAGCRDEGAERYEKARRQYEALLSQHALPGAPGFDLVLSELDLVPRSSAKAQDAERLAHAIRLARSPTVRTPLALAPKDGSRPPALEAQLAACARLAELAGADGGVGSRALEALEDCRRKAERLELSLSHGDDAHDGGTP
ncbi:MAG: hypothetical protein AMXMBFR34_08930 [Myxococcaceae bacterium]